ncbi:amino acid ABC transporter permease [Propionicimonas sp.]|uniref:amino acid ABC transporter permease n=1 Tax=Propionicimonas sp. TaxID=1955623 RepID=UPI001DFB5D5B|nr:amino acid ABC transporter permease [Propionicimonas sp.]MBU3976174.1 amino acid ABC transporter permease [Actinomycetota bacterium]MBU3985569.1 amino acid ABC transporter permease [Actinomycetota bacterium]MBU4008354.1 amino acid ABC transporter permease [Actinomycetota bacterium]MBU4066496.1 amino acid ABC transporter permease [Actinomycetota bacterium]MBU4093944.1 amino acid ABC transporter permease [Actinomycetota bacterium]
MAAFIHLRPTTRRRLGRWATYVLAVVVVVVVALPVNWPEIGRLFFNPEIAAKMWPTVVTVALKNTLIYTFAGFVGGTIFGTVLALMKIGRGPFGAFATAYIEFFRGIPMLLTIFAIAFMIPIAFPGASQLSGVVGGVIGLIMVTAAYTAEIIRSGIQAVPPGQAEAARSLGMSSLQTMFWVVLPQGFRIVIPPLTNEFVMLLKDTSLIFIAGLMVTEKELTTFARDDVSKYFNATPLMVAAAAYLVVTLPLTWMAGKLEKKLDPKR